MTAATINGKPTRKQLIDKLDRLDGIIDARWPTGAIRRWPTPPARAPGWR
jgi:hypothetical protein